MHEATQISPAQARKLVLLSQGIHKERELGRGKNATLKAIQKLGYIQIDTISVVERAHHHTLWSRTQNYQHKHLNELQRSGDIFEYWSHAAAFLPMCDYRYSLPRKQAIDAGEKHWFRVEHKILDEVLARVTAEGPLQSKDFENTDMIHTGWGDFKVGKRALEDLFMRGKLMISERKGFQKVYDLPERVLPEGIDTSVPTEEEFLHHLIFSFVQAQGLGTPSQVGHLRKGIKPKLLAACEQLVESGELVRLRTGGNEYFALAGFEQTLEQSLSRHKIKILSPFDNLIIQRDRGRDLFNFDYQIECYVTEKKRKHGYFVLPILWGHEFAGRMDAKIDRKTKHLTVHKLFVETKKRTEFLERLNPALAEFCAFNGGEQFTIKEIIDL